MRRVAVFGSTGGSGRTLVRRAIGRELDVVAYARRPERLGELRGEVEVVEGELSDAQRIAEALEGVDTVFSLLGPKTITPGRRPLTEGMRHVVRGMEIHGITRILAIATPSVKHPGDAPHALMSPMGVLIRRLGGPAFDELRGMADVLRGSDLEWTLARIPFLTNGPASEEPEVGPLSWTSSLTLSRETLAAWMLDEATRRDWVRGAPVLGDGPS